MPKPRRIIPFPQDQALFTAKPRKSAPHQFVLDALASLSPTTRAMFGCLAVYVVGQDCPHTPRQAQRYRRQRSVAGDHRRTSRQSVAASSRTCDPFRVLGKGVTGWQVLPADAPDFEEASLRACELIIARDSRIGKVPGARRRSRQK